MTYEKQRELLAPKGAELLRDDKINVSVYIGVNKDGKPTAMAFSGKRTKPDFFYRFKTNENRDNHIEKYVLGKHQELADKEAYKQEKKDRITAFKAKVQIGTILRTSFSYNMTFNDFFEVVAIKGAKVTLAVLDKEWVSGDIGWTGQVKQGKRVGKEIEARYSVNGLQIAKRTASIVEEGQDFYENHLD